VLYTKVPPSGGAGAAQRGGAGAAPGRRRGGAGAAPGAEDEGMDGEGGGGWAGRRRGF